MSRVTPKEIEEINKLYAIYKSYSKVAQEVGRAPGTVKRYVDPNYVLKEPEPKPIHWDRLNGAPAIDLKEGWTGKYTCDKPYDDTANAYYLESHPSIKDRYIISNNFNIIPMPQLTTSYLTVNARLIGMDYEEFIAFCEECMGAIINRSDGAKFAGIYFKNTTDTQKLVALMNRKFRESYEQSVLHKK